METKQNNEIDFLKFYKHDLSKELRKKPTFYKDKDGKMQKTSEDKWLSYVEWATILAHLYILGCKDVSFKSVLSPDKENTLIIKLSINGKEYETDYPIIDGNAIITKPNQMQIHKAELRGFVKCVAIHTGLGLSLWQKEESLFNEIPPTDEPKESIDDVLKKTNLFISWNDKLSKIETKAQLLELYKNNEKLIGTNNQLKALFIKKQSELK